MHTTSPFLDKKLPSFKAELDVELPATMSVKLLSSNSGLEIAWEEEGWGSEGEVAMTDVKAEKSTRSATRVARVTRNPRQTELHLTRQQSEYWPLSF